MDYAVAIPLAAVILTAGGFALALRAGASKATHEDIAEWRQALLDQMESLRGQVLDCRKESAEFRARLDNLGQQLEGCRQENVELMRRILQGGG